MKPRLELSTLTVLLLTLGCDAPSTTPVAGGVPDKPTQPDRGEPTAVTIPVENPSASDEAYYTDRLSKWDCMSQATPGFVSQGEHVEIAPGTRTTTSTPLELFWSVCNEGATGSGPSYRLVTELLTIDPNAAVPVTVTPVSELT